MEEKISSLINLYYKEKNIKYEMNKDYKKVMIKNFDIVTDVDLLRYILVNTKFEQKNDYDYFYYTTKTCKFYFSNEREEKDLDLIYSNIIQTYNENSENFYKYAEILNELVTKKLVNVIENKFRKENSDEIKIFAKFLFYYINNLTNEQIKLENFIYSKKFCAVTQKQKILELKDDSNKISKLIKECNEVLDIFDEIYDTKIFTNLNKYIIEFDKIYNNKLLITNEENKFIIQMIVTNNTITKIEPLIKKIKNIFKNDTDIILYVNEYNTDLLFILFKEGFISHLIIKNDKDKNLLMLKNNKDLFLYYDYNEKNSTDKIIENEFAFINKYLNNYFENMYLVFNKEYKIHKIIIDKNLNNFRFYIKDLVEQNYFNINEYKEEKGNYSLYLYSKDNTLCFDIFNIKYPTFKNLFSLWLKHGNNIHPKINDNINSLIAIKGYDLLIKCSIIIKNKYYNKIIFQESIEIDDDYIQKQEFENILDKKSSCFNTKNIYIVDSLDNYLENEKELPSKLMKKYNKRGFNDLLPAFYLSYKKYPTLNRKTILLQISYFMSYNLNIYKNINDKEE